MLQIGIAADHGGFALKEEIVGALRERRCVIVDFGAHELNPNDD